MSPVRSNGAGSPSTRALPVVPNDPLFGQQYALAKIDAPGAWGVAGTAGTPSPVIVAIVDTGILLNHPDLQGVLVAGATCIPAPCTSGPGAGNDDNGHGTHVAGITGAGGNNAAGVTGVALRPGVKLMPVKVLDAAGSGTNAAVAAGIRWAVDNGAKVINLSLGGAISSQTINAEIDYAYSHGVLVVVSGGNCGGAGYAANGCSAENEWDYPAGYAATQPAKLIPVAATDQADAHASFSTVADYIRTGGVSAPGRSILSTSDPSLPVFRGTASCLADSPSYCLLSGTSMAAPHVAGLAALLWSANPSLSVDAVRTAIVQAATDLGPAGADATFGAALPTAA